MVSSRFMLPEKLPVSFLNHFSPGLFCPTVPHSRKQKIPGRNCRSSLFRGLNPSFRFLYGTQRFRRLFSVLQGTFYSVLSVSSLSSGITEILSSSSCFWSTSEGASIIRQDASLIFGKAMTSRMLSAPTISMITRSRP